LFKRLAEKAGGVGMSLLAARTGMGALAPLASMMGQNMAGNYADKMMASDF